MKRGAVKTTKSEMVALWLPKPLANALDTEVQRADSDRSKIIRHAIREKLARSGIVVKEAA